MKELAVIVPIHDIGNENINTLKKAIESVPDGVSIYISVPNGTSASKLSDAIGRATVVVSEGNGTTFCDLVNNGVAAINANDDIKWFSILEFDDTYTGIWLDNARKYIDFMPDTSVFMTLEDITDFGTGKYVGFGNEAAWASSFSNEIGYIDSDCLQNYFDFYLTGSIFNKADWNEVGGLKPSIKVTFWYEWLLRATYKGKKVFVIPKVGYNHSMGRKGSLVEMYKESMKQEEIDWYFDLAKRECYYKEDRNKTYEEYKKNIDEGND